MKHPAASDHGSPFGFPMFPLSSISGAFVNNSRQLGWPRAAAVRLTAKARRNTHFLHKPERSLRELRVRCWLDELLPDQRSTCKSSDKKSAPLLQISQSSSGN